MRDTMALRNRIVAAAMAQRSVRTPHDRARWLTWMLGLGLATAFWWPVDRARDEHFDRGLASASAYLAANLASNLGD